MEEILDSGRVDRRALLIGGASLVTGGTLLQAGEASASADGVTWIPAVVEAQISESEVDVIPLQRENHVRVHLEPGTPVFAGLDAGNGVLIEGAEDPEGIIAAARVVRGVFGERSDFDI